MRNVVTPGFALLAIGVLAACGSGGSSVPGSVANSSGGGAPLSGTQPASALAVPPILLDGGVLPVPTYTGLNVTATDSQSTLDAYSDRYVSPDNSTKFTYEPPINPPGSHLISFSTTLPMTEEIFQLVQPNEANPPPPITLTYDSKQAGVSTSTTYAAIALYLGPSTGLAVAVAYDIEVSGGFGATAYDVRIGCVQQENGTASQLISNTNPTLNAVFIRYLCALPKYGSPSGFYLTTLSPTLTASSKFLSATILHPIVTGATGAFTPTVTSYPYPLPTGNLNGSLSPQIALVLDESGTASGTSPMPLPPTTNAQFTLDYMYAEALNY